MQKISNIDLGRPTVEEFANMEKMPVTVVLDGIRSSNNIGTFFRTGDAFGVERVELCGICATPPNKDIHKTALGAENTVPWRYHKSCVEAIELLRSEGYMIFAVEQVENSIMLHDFRVESDVKYALVFGNEVFGVSQEVVDMCDGYIEIPQVGTKHSLNVSVSAGIVLWSMFSQSKFVK